MGVLLKYLTGIHWCPLFFEQRWYITNQPVLPEFSNSSGNPIAGIFILSPIFRPVREIMAFIKTLSQLPCRVRLTRNFNSSNGVFLRSCIVQLAHSQKFAFVHVGSKLSHRLLTYQKIRSPVKNKILFIRY